MPGDALGADVIEAHAQSLADRFLGRESSGQLGQAVAIADELLRSVDAPQKSLSIAFDGPLDAILQRDVWGAA